MGSTAGTKQCFIGAPAPAIHRAKRLKYTETKTAFNKCIQSWDASCSHDNHTDGNEKENSYDQHMCDFINENMQRNYIKRHK